MKIEELNTTMAALAIAGKGILAADESNPTMGKRLASINVENTEEYRRQYRELLFTTPNLNQYINGIILYEETLHQKSSEGERFVDILTNVGIIPGIKVDKGLIALENSQEKLTQGLDGLAERLSEYKNLGARFAKWRAVYTIACEQPSHKAIVNNAFNLARYAAICQSLGIVPIVEPEVLMDGDHSLEHCFTVTETVLNHVFTALKQQAVYLEGIILKPSMVIHGSEHSSPANSTDIANATVSVLKRTVPAAVRSINFLSGGQSPEFATENLNAINQIDDSPWLLSYSYGRALQAPCLTAWAGNANNTAIAQAALYKRAKLNSLASTANYARSMETE